MSWEISVSIVIGLQAAWLRNQGSIPGWEKRFFSSPPCPGWLRVPCSILYTLYLGLFTQD
jgi:hypothetical protein